MSDRTTTPIKPYLLRVMMPGTTEDVLDDFTADLPFGSIAAGDLLDLEQARRENGSPLLRVVARNTPCPHGPGII